MPTDFSTPHKASLAPELAPIAEAFDNEMDHRGLTMGQMRAAYREGLLAQGVAQNPVSTRELSVPTRHGPVATRLYTPPASSPTPLIVYMHGGGFVVGDLDCVDVPLHLICRESGIAILSVDYALAPEAKFPVALEQCEDVLRYAVIHGAAIGGNGRLGVAGDSAGGNLSALLAQRLRGDPQVQIAWQCMINPVVDIRGARDEDSPSMRTYRDGPILKRDVMLWFNEMYHESIDDEIAASPARTQDLSGLPPAFVVTAECDALTDHTAAYATRMRSAGADVIYTCYRGMFHNFIAYTQRSPTAYQMVMDVARAARECLCGAAI
ncbi:MAG: alpha/beta hydrolase [Betaproteobacteria bacterium]|nr:alpha/beta hydrolase [Betaproteobacteria bacterium]